MMRLLLVFVAVVAMLEFTLADPVEEDKDIEVRMSQFHTRDRGCANSEM